MNWLERAKLNFLPASKMDVRKLQKSLQEINLFKRNQFGYRHQYLNDADNVPYQISAIKGDLTFLLDPSSLVDQWLLKTGEWEKDQIDFLFSNCIEKNNQSQKIFLDIGSYSGLYSLLAFKMNLFRSILQVKVI
jgi:hypothetical protein